MGDRANLAIVENGVIDLRYDHWAATSISFDVFTDGPGPTLQRVRSMTRLNPEEPGSWLDDVWPGWRSVCHGDDYEWQERMAALNGIRPSLDHDIAAVRARIQREIGRRPANPAVRVVRMLSAAGRAASLSPAASAHVPATSRAAMPQVLAALTELETNGLVNLLPCRFLSDEGEVVSPAGNR
ncbi:hypothetical protein ACFVDI_20410 [Nocardioides sp. NPDC057767]|uniref:hypothetical protein n=1 Tax=unclassified Nocardioides TaxID=2615069 RepID=UPI00366E5388